ncbi:MAG: LysR family transcriptional regulator, partial [Clostridia bacterium]|nr:LysR family transcriptional regulator [Clostridia bacterium]
MNTKQLRYLVTIAQFGSLSRASQALGVSQPALSKALAEWENTYGFLFFLRYRRKLSPTAAGRYMIEAAQKILDEQNRMLLTMRAVMGDERQNIRLCTAPNRAAIIYSQIYHDFSRRYPDITLQLAERYASEQPKAVQRGQVDLALGAGPVTDVVEDIPFAREVLLVALPASHPLAGQKSVRLEELKDTPFVLQGERHSIRTIADELFRKAGFLPVVAFESNDVLLLDAMMHQAIGAGFVSNIHVFPCEDLVYLPLDPPVYQLTHIRYPKGHELTEAERYLAGLLIRHRLSDPRYEAIRSPKVRALLDAVTEAEQEALPGMMKADGAGVQELREISLDTSALERIVAIVEEGSLSRAAKRFYLAQPALSRILRNMEEMRGLDLFTRDHHRLIPTHAGKIVVNSARNMLRFEAEMEAYIKDYRKG